MTNKYVLCIQFSYKNDGNFHIGAEHSWPMRNRHEHTRSLTVIQIHLCFIYCFCQECKYLVFK